MNSSNSTQPGSANSNATGANYSESDTPSSPSNNSPATATNRSSSTNAPPTTLPPPTPGPRRQPQGMLPCLDHISQADRDRIIEMMMLVTVYMPELDGSTLPAGELRVGPILDWAPQGIRNRMLELILGASVNAHYDPLPEPVFQQLVTFFTQIQEESRGTPPGSSTVAGTDSVDGKDSSKTETPVKQSSSRFWKWTENIGLRRPQDSLAVAAGPSETAILPRMDACQSGKRRAPPESSCQTAKFSRGPAWGVPKSEKSETPGTKMDTQVSNRNNEVALLENSAVGKAVVGAEGRRKKQTKRLRKRYGGKEWKGLKKNP